MPEFLSPEWIAELDAAAKTSEALRAGAADVRATIEQVVPDAPGGAVRYHVTIDRGDVHVCSGPADAPDVTLVTGYEAARTISDGTATAQQALTAGSLEIKGELARFVGLDRALAAVGDVFAAVRARTTYADPGT